MSTPSRYLLTARGIERLRRRISDARDAYQAVCASNSEAREAGDSSVWHDNFAFEENQRQMHQLGRRVRDLEGILARIETVELPRAPGRASVGTRVRYRFEDEVVDRTVVLAGWDDGDPAAQRLSYNSPLGAALHGAMPGEEREAALAGRARTLVVLTVEEAEDR